MTLQDLTDFLQNETDGERVEGGALIATATGAGRILVSFIDDLDPEGLAVFTVTIEKGRVLL